MDKLFICYSHKDDKIVDAILGHLAVYDTEIDAWNDQRIAIGDKWKNEIERELSKLITLRHTNKIT